MRWFSKLIHLSIIHQSIVKYCALQLPQQARPILHSEIKLELAMPRLSFSVSQYLQKQQIAHRYDKDLFARLRFLRKQIANKENIPPYVVFNNATLQEMLNINGV